MDYGKRLSKHAVRDFKVWLVTHNLSQAAFARMCGVSRQYINQVLNGDIYITNKIIDMFANAGYQIKKDR